MINDMSEGTRIHLWEKHIKNEIYLQSHNVFPSLLFCLLTLAAAVDVFFLIYDNIQIIIAPNSTKSSTKMLPNFTQKSESL